MSCYQVRELLDDFLASELASQASLEIDGHLETCKGCSDELRFRQSVRGLLRRSVESDKPSASLRARILDQIPDRKNRSRFFLFSFQWGMGAAAGLAAVIILLGGLRWRANRIYHDPAAQAAYIQKVSEGIPAIQKVGLADHIHCAFLRRYPQEYPKQAIAEQQLGPELSGLARQVKAKLPPDYQVILAHRCSYAGRHYIHFVLRSDAHLMSVVLTEKQDGETFTGLSLTRAGDTPIYQASAGQFQVTGFDGGKYLAYIVSDLDRAGSLEMAGDIVPLVAGTLKAMKS